MIESFLVESQVTFNKRKLYYSINLTLFCNRVFEFSMILEYIIFKLPLIIQVRILQLRGQSYDSVGKIYQCYLKVADTPVSLIS